jgi:hypothetical protein
VALPALEAPAALSLPAALAVLEDLPNPPPDLPVRLDQPVLAALLAPPVPAGRGRPCRPSALASLSGPTRSPSRSGDSGQSPDQ